MVCMQFSHYTELILWKIKSIVSQSKTKTAFVSPGHPYERTSSWSPWQVNTINREDLSAFYLVFIGQVTGWWQTGGCNVLNRNSASVIYSIHWKHVFEHDLFLLPTVSESCLDLIGQNSVLHSHWLTPFKSDLVCNWFRTWRPRKTCDSDTAGAWTAYVLLTWKLQHPCQKPFCTCCTKCPSLQYNIADYFCLIISCPKTHRYTSVFPISDFTKSCGEMLSRTDPVQLTEIQPAVQDVQFKLHINC